QVNRGISWSSEFRGTKPSAAASVVSPSLQCEALTWKSGLGAAVSTQVCASGPLPIAGKAEIRSRAHGNESDGLGGLVGLHGAVLKRGDEAEAVELLFRNPPRLRLQCDGHSVEGERHVRLRPCPLGDLERGGRAIRVEHQPVPRENAERGMRNGEGEMADDNCRMADDNCRMADGR